MRHFAIMHPESPPAPATDADTPARPARTSPVVANDAASADVPSQLSWRGRWLHSSHTVAVRHRRPMVRVLVALTSTTALLAVAALVATAAIVPPIGARLAARRAAQQEVDAQLRDGEQVVARVFASQRRWTDVWRESFGILVATDSRLLYVGAPPTPLLRPREDGPDELLVESYPYDAAFTLEPHAMLYGALRGLTLRTPGQRINFVVGDEEWRDANIVSEAAARARVAVTRELEQQSDLSRVIAAPAAQYVPYIVQRGETLIGLARRFNTSPDVIRQLNQLQGDEIRVGQRLRVPSVQP